ncbi:MAG: TIGR02680 family protein [Firmicutes bacterium]|nr:TIGR02680 family protein [Bacillota bacterium]
MTVQPSLLDAWTKAPASLQEVCRSLPGGPRGWRPSRLILQNYWVFQYEEFHFTHGRLVLRGANATGKSTVLVSAITLVLDGEKRRERLDTFGGQGRGVAYYLVGPADATPDSDFYYDERTGYVALEFEHATEGRFLTIGVGLYTSRNRPDLSVDSWGFALTDGRRIGIDFHLYDDDRIPLTRRQLAQRIGIGGAVVESAADYQALVNRLLFGYEDIRDYEFLLQLLLQLRSPKLNKDMKPSMICEMLRDSLPPLPGSLLGQVTQILDDIDDCLEDVEHTEACLKAAEVIDESYAHFLNQKAQLAAAALRRADAAAAEARRKEEEAAAGFERATRELEAVRARLRALQEEAVRVEARRRTLEEHEAYRDHQQLARWREELERAERSLHEAEEAVRASEAALRRVDDAARALEDEWAQLREAWQRAAADLEEAAARAAWDFGRWEAGAAAKLVRELQEDEDDEPQWSAAPLAAAAEARIERLRELGAAYRAAEEAAQRHEAARQNAQREQELLDAADARLRSAEQGLERAREAALEAFRAWLEAVSAFAPQPGLEAQVASALNAYLQAKPGSADVSWASCLNPVRRAVDAMEAGLHAEIRRLGAALELAKRERDRLAGELQEWQEEREPAPPRREEQAAARRILAAAGVPAEPLYALCDVREGIGLELAAQLEAALDEAGLLDALVVPVEAAEDVERRLAEAGLGDRWLRPSDRIPAAGQAGDAPTGTLLDVLRPLEGHPAARDVAAALTNIAWHPAAGADGLAGLAAAWEASAPPAAISPTAWRVGNLHGRTSRRAEAQPRYIGEANRRRYREAIIARLRADLEDQERQVWQLESELDAARMRLQKLRAEFDELQAMPAWTGLPGAVERVRHAASWVEERRQALDAANAAAEAAYRHLQAAREAYETLAAGLPEARGSNLDDLRDLMEAARQTVACGRALESELRRVKPWRQRRRQNAQDREAALARLERDRLRAGEAAEQRARWQEQCRTLEERLAQTGVRVEDLLEELRALNQQEARLKQEELQLVEQVGALSTEVQRSHRDLDDARAEVERTRHRREEAVAALRSALSAYPSLAPLLEMAEEDDESGPLRAAGELLKFRRSEEKDLEDAVRESLDRARQQLITHFADQRAQLVDYSPSLEEDGRVTFRHMGQTVAPYRLRAILLEDLALKRRVLQEKERELYEDIILREVARQVRARISAARDWRDQINRLLAARQLSNGEVLSISWNPVADRVTGLDFSRIVELLQRDVETLTEDEVKELVEHFRQRVGQVRQQYRDDQLDQSFAEALANVLDYRHWFRFQLHSKLPNEPRRELTDLRFAARSGAEKSLAMFVPILASVHARYRLAAPDAPRLIGMDEAFAGVDEQNIREMFRFLVELDFCWIMTSEKLWGVSDALPGCSTYELVRSGTVVTPIWTVWDGTRARNALTAAAGAAGAGV